LVQEVQRYIGSGLTSGMAKYEALIAGMKKARSLHVNHLLAKCNSRLLIKQVILCRHHDPSSLSLSLSQPSQLINVWGEPVFSVTAAGSFCEKSG
jgi:Uri superfamily endonuclease